MKEIVITINETNGLLEQALSNFGGSNDVLKLNLGIAIDVMNNCLDVIYDLLKTSYPKIYRPELCLSNSMEVNAYADHSNKRIVVNKGLILYAQTLIQRYKNVTLEEYHILEGQNEISVQSGIRVHLWRFVILHELYHLWNGHSQWKAQYRVNENGKIVLRTKQLHSSISTSLIISEANNLRKTTKKALIESNITSQALELDADASAVCMLINLLFFDMKNRKIENRFKKDYIKVHVAFIMAGIASAFCLFGRNSGAKFELLDTLDYSTHPIPAIRFIYAEEIADACLDEHIKDGEELAYVESEWLKIVCDVEADYNGTVDMGQVFFYPAYTEIAQKHLCKSKRRLNDMHDTLQEFALGNTAPKLDEDTLVYDSNRVWFDKKGRSLRGWKNPATGRDDAVRSDKIPVVVKKIGRNAPCPCGSGKKYKNCCGS